MDASAIGFNAEVKSKSDINVGMHLSVHCHRIL